MKIKILSKINTIKNWTCLQCHRHSYVHKDIMTKKEKKNCTCFEMVSTIKLKQWDFKYKVKLSMNVLPVLLYWLRILVLRLKRHVKDQILPRKVRKVRGTSCRGQSIFLVHQRSLPLTKWAELNGRSHANLWRKGLLDRGKRKNKNELRAHLVCSEFTEGAVCQSGLSVRRGTARAEVIQVEGGCHTGPWKPQSGLQIFFWD